MSREDDAGHTAQISRGGGCRRRRSLGRARSRPTRVPTTGSRADRGRSRPIATNSTIVTKQEMGGQVTESTQVWTVVGSTLTVETTSARGTLKRVYKKVVVNHLPSHPVATRSRSSRWQPRRSG